jgi:hypothetical protein
MSIKLLLLEQTALIDRILHSVEEDSTSSLALRKERIANARSLLKILERTLVTAGPVETETH